VAALAAAALAASAAYGNFASPFVFLVRLWRTSLAILKFYLFPAEGGIAQKRKRIFAIEKYLAILLY